MEDKGYLVTPAMVYGAEWMARHAEELEKWEWEFRPYKNGETALVHNSRWVTHNPTWEGSDGDPRIILRRRKVPPAPQLLEVYGKDSISIKCDKEWTGEFRTPEYNELYLNLYGGSEYYLTHPSQQRGKRLILRDRTPPVKVWLKAEEEARHAKEWEWVWDSTYKKWEVVRSEWLNNIGTTAYTYLCATRHEEPDLTPTVVTQADVDAAWARQHGGGE